MSTLSSLALLGAFLGIAILLRSVINYFIMSDYRRTD